MPDDPQPPVPPHANTTDELRRAIAAQRDQLKTQLEIVRLIEEAIASMERRLALMEGTSRSTSDDTNGTVADMDVSTSGKDEAVRRAIGRSRRKHPAQAAFYKHNKTIGQVAAELGEGRPRVSSWMAEGDACREIPRRIAELLKKKYGVPLNAWTRLGN